MNNKKFRFNPKTLAMEQVEHGLRYWLRQTGIYIRRYCSWYGIFIPIFVIFSIPS